MSQRRFHQYAVVGIGAVQLIACAVLCMDVAERQVVPTAAQFGWREADSAIRFLAFSPSDEQLLVSLVPKGESIKHQIIILRRSNAEELYRVESTFPLAICFSPDGFDMAVLAADGLTIHDIGRQQIRVRIDRKSFGPRIQSLGFTTDGQIVVGAGQFLDPDTDFFAWNSSTGDRVPRPANNIVWTGRGVSPDGTMFIAGGWPGPTPRIYKTDRTDRITYCFRDKLPIAVTFTPDSRNLVTIHEDGLLVIWEIKPTDNDNARQLATESSFDECVSFAISHDQKWIATAEKDGSIWIRNFPSLSVR